jgi:membrane protease YdiL (CAAX protease family)
MFKNILKSVAWVSLYFVVSMIGSVIAIVIYLLSGSITIPTNLDDTTVFTDFVTQVIAKSAVPSIIISSIICIIVYICYKFIKKDKLDISQIDFKKIPICIGIGLFLNSTISVLLALLTPFIPQQHNDALNEVMTLVTTGNPIILLLGTGILGPILEEIIFRHGIHRTLSRSNLIIAYVVSSLSFGIAHGNLIQGTYAGILGFVLAFILTNTDNLLYPIIVHMTINTSSTLITFLPDSIPEIWILVIMFVLSIFLTVPFLKSDSSNELFSKNNTKIST